MVANTVTVSELENLSVLIFNAVQPKLKGGVKRFADNLVTGVRSKHALVYDLIGSKRGITKNFFKVLKDYVKYLDNVKVIHFIVLSPYNVPFVILAKIFGKKIISTYHGIYFEESSLVKSPHIFVPFWIADKIYKLFSDVIISPSEYLLRVMKITGKTAVIPNPLNPEAFKKQLSKSDIVKFSDEIVLTCISDFSNRKKSGGLRLLLDAMDDIAKELFSIKLLVFGDGKNLDSIKSKYGSRKNIIFMGFRDDLHHFMSCSDAYLHISGLDNQPYSVIEAMMLGKVIFCNDLGGLVEMIDPKNNYIVSLDSMAIAKGLRSLIADIQNNRELFKEKGQRNRAFAINRYSADIIALKHIEIYKGVMQPNHIR